MYFLQALHGVAYHNETQDFHSFSPLTYLNHFLWTLPFLGFPAAYPQIIHQIKFPVDYQNNNQQKKKISCLPKILFNPTLGLL